MERFGLRTTVLTRSPRSSGRETSATPEMRPLCLLWNSFLARQVPGGLPYLISPARM